MDCGMDMQLHMRKAIAHHFKEFYGLSIFPLVHCSKGILLVNVTSVGVSSGALRSHDRSPSDLLVQSFFLETCYLLPSVCNQGSVRKPHTVRFTGCAVRRPTIRFGTVTSGSHKWSKFIVQDGWVQPDINGVRLCFGCLRFDSSVLCAVKRFIL